MQKLWRQICCHGRGWSEVWRRDGLVILHADFQADSCCQLKSVASKKPCCNFKSPDSRPQDSSWSFPAAIESTGRRAALGCCHLNEMKNMRSLSALLTKTKHYQKGRRTRLELRLPQRVAKSCQDVVLHRWDLSNDLHIISREYPLFFLMRAFLVKAYVSSRWDTPQGLEKCTLRCLHCNEVLAWSYSWTVMQPLLLVDARSSPFESNSTEETYGLRTQEGARRLFKILHTPISSSVCSLLLTEYKKPEAKHIQYPSALTFMAWHG